MTKIQKRIQEAYAACYRLCKSDRHASEWLARSLDSARRGEVGHRKMGARFTRGEAAYKLPIADAARFFAVKWFLHGANGVGQAPTSFEDACGIREDALFGLGARDKVRGIIGKASDWQALCRKYADVAGLDYAEVFPDRKAS